jgi:hypothetical protein
MLSAHFGLHRTLHFQMSVASSGSPPRDRVQTRGCLIMIQLHSNNRYRIPSPQLYKMIAATMNTHKHQLIRSSIPFGPHHPSVVSPRQTSIYVMRSPDEASRVLFHGDCNDSEPGNFWANSSFLSRSQMRCRHIENWKVCHREGNWQQKTYVCSSSSRKPSREWRKLKLFVH